MCNLCTIIPFVERYLLKKRWQTIQCEGKLCCLYVLQCLCLFLMFSSDSIIFIISYKNLALKEYAVINNTLLSARIYKIT